MKKSLLIILTAIVTFIISSNVYASSFYSQVLPSIYIHKQNAYVDSYQSAGAFKERDTNNVAYCIEPFTGLIEEEYATSYTEYTDYNSVFGLTHDQLDRINDIAYFGYGYENHLDDKWISVTQMMIWKEIDSGATFDWIDNTYDRNTINPYENEMKEINTLINTKNIKPSFANNSEYISGRYLILEDSNEVLSNYEIVDTSGLIANIEGNSVFIMQEGDSEYGKIVLVHKGEESKGKYYYSNNSQNMLVKGGYSPVEVCVYVKFLKGSITIQKIDEDSGINTSHGEANINGAIFELYDEYDELKSTIELDNEGKATIKDLDIGKYKLVEKSSGEGYINSNNIHEIELTINNNDITVVISNKVIESKIIIIKTYGSNNDYNNNTMKREANISFDIYDKDDNLVGTITTDEYGTCEMLLPYGTYKIVQKNTTDNYYMVDDTIISIDSNSPAEIVLDLKDYEIEVPNTGI